MERDDKRRSEGMTENRKRFQTVGARNHDKQ
jgi:hypothetical protein